MLAFFVVVLHQLDCFGVDWLAGFQAAAIAYYYLVAFVNPETTSAWVAVWMPNTTGRISIVLLDVRTSTVTLSPL